MIRRTLAAALCAVAALAATSAAAFAQVAATPPPDTHEGEVAAQQAEKARALGPYRAPLLERVVQEIDEHFLDADYRWHPFYGHAYPGAGVTLGAGYLFRPGDYDTLDVRAAMSLNASKRAEVVYRAPRLAKRRASLTMVGGWSEGIGQAFFGLERNGTTDDDDTDFDFRRAYTAAQVEVRPWRGVVVFGGGLGYQRYEQRVGAVEPDDDLDDDLDDDDFAARYSAATLPGFGATVNYVQAHGSAGLDWRPARGYARRGGAWGVTARHSVDTAGDFTFTQVDYDVVQHVPVLRDAWVLSLHARAETTFAPSGHEVPFFMLPTLGNAMTLRGYANQRFRDRNSMLLTAEWRVLLNALVDLAFFYDAGKVTERPRQFSLRGLESDYGVGVRFHSYTTTPLRIDVARGREGLRVAFGAVAAF
jgi:hypothetical protein